MKTLLALSAWLFAVAASWAQDVVTFVHYSDCHASLIGQGTYRTNAEAIFNWIHAHTNDGVYNVRGVILTGDNFQQQAKFCDPSGFQYNPDKFQIGELTNALWGLVNAGVHVWMTDGNHDADNVAEHKLYDGTRPDITTGALQDSESAYAWNSYIPLSLFTNQVGFVTNYQAGKSQMTAMTYTNGPLKLLWIPISCSITTILNGVVYDFNPQVKAQMDWAKAIAAQYPDHNVILGAHFLLGWSDKMQRALLRNDYAEGPGAVIYRYLPHGRSPFDTGALDITNTLCWLSGHTRNVWSDHTVLRATNGHRIDVQVFNLQQSSLHGSSGNANGRYVRLLMFDMRRKLVRIETLDVANDALLTSDWTREFPPGTVLQYYPVRWTIPWAVPHQKRLIFR